MKCIKYDQAWFDNKYIQLLNMQCGSEKKLQKLNAFMKLAKEHKITPKATKESKQKVRRDDYGKPKSERSIRARKSRLKRKQKARKI